MPSKSSLHGRGARLMAFPERHVNIRRGSRREMANAVRSGVIAGSTLAVAQASCRPTFTSSAEYPAGCMRCEMWQRHNVKGRRKGHEFHQNGFRLADQRLSPLMTGPATMAHVLHSNCPLADVCNKRARTKLCQRSRAKMIKNAATLGRAGHGALQSPRFRTSIRQISMTIKPTPDRTAITSSSEVKAAPTHCRRR